MCTYTHSGHTRFRKNIYRQPVDVVVAFFVSVILIIQRNTLIIGKTRTHRHKQAHSQNKQRMCFIKWITRRDFITKIDPLTCSNAIM